MDAERWSRGGWRKTLPSLKNVCKQRKIEVPPLRPPNFDRIKYRRRHTVWEGVDLAGDPAEQAQKQQRWGPVRRMTAPGPVRAPLPIVAIGTRCLGTVVYAEWPPPIVANAVNSKKKTFWRKNVARKLTLKKVEKNIGLKNITEVR